MNQSLRWGGRLRLKSKPNYIYTIHSLTWDDNKKLAYRLLPNNDKHLIVVSLDRQDNYELVPNKFDIAALKPFDKVLVRTKTFTPAWTIDFYDGYRPNIGGSFTPFAVTGGKYFQQCIPYEKNEHLLGTTKDCNEFYKTWE